jgi:PleD family two-component response regulator
VVLASANLEVARLRADNVVDAVARQPWGDVASGLSVSLSIGLASGSRANVQDLIAAADAALYEAKAAGGNRIVTGRPADPAVVSQRE